MALFFMDGFDGYSTASDLSIFYSGIPCGFSTSGGRFGGGALALNNGGYQVLLPNNLPTNAWYSFAFYSGNAGNTGVLFMISSGGGWETRCDYTPSLGLLSFSRGNNNLLYGTSYAITANAWHWIDIHLNIAGSGVAEFWVDGVQVINYSGQTYQNSSTGPYLFQWGNNGIGGVQGAFIDDFVINDTSGTINNGRIGDSKIETLRPTSDAGPNNGTPSTGTNHFAVVADATWNSSDYITITNTSGQEELFGIADLSSSPASIAAVQIVHYTKKSDAGDANIQTVCVSGGTESDGASAPVPPSFARLLTILETDPHTSAAWTASAVNAMQAGVKVP